MEPAPADSSGTGDWTRPGADAVAPGVHRIPLPLPGDGLRAVNVFAIEDGNRIALVDAGWHREDSRAALRAGLGEIGAELGDLSHVLVTHIHHDHIGQAAALRRASGAVFLLGEGERRGLDAIIDDALRAKADAHRHRQLAAHGATALADEAEAAWRGVDDRRRRGHAEWEAPDRFVGDARPIELATRRLHVVATPGHTRGHVGFLDEAAGLYFAGDHVLPQITPSLGLEPFSDGLALVDFIASLARVRQLRVALVLPAHGPVFSGLRERVDALLEHHADRLAACSAAVRSEERCAFEVAELLPWTRRGRAYRELDLFNRVLAVHETIAHLELLAVQGTLARREVDGVIVFGMASPPHPATAPRA